MLVTELFTADISTSNSPIPSPGGRVIYSYGGV